MALISCYNPSCNQQVSSKAPACPKCGTVISKIFGTQVVKSEEEINDLIARITKNEVCDRIIVLGEVSQKVSKAYNQIKKHDGKLKKDHMVVAGAIISIAAVIAGAKADNEFVKMLGIGGSTATAATALSSNGDEFEALMANPLARQVKFLHSRGFRLLSNSSDTVVLIKV
ncbi:hypothetical protein Pse7367_2545 [Thalassoporum mexicanum PCC 7367]|uniref:hypothetical protein n=1 Tax=Thalassoporum mexicanum TaxID=3457544 RepID=UPI0002A000F2|nr:hypothetical protein [Pseudanabaena sp. PCC 7367]AFY70805.1 hypothetical protein Pse7367_2545 [Pseudanabaena sp. PCC 7367]